MRERAAIVDDADHDSLAGQLPAFVRGIRRHSDVADRNTEQRRVRDRQRNFGADKAGIEDLSQPVPDRLAIGHQGRVPGVDSWKLYRKAVERLVGDELGKPVQREEHPRPGQESVESMDVGGQDAGLLACDPEDDRQRQRAPGALRVDDLARAPRAARIVENKQQQAHRRTQLLQLDVGEHPGSGGFALRPAGGAAGTFLATANRHGILRVARQRTCCDRTAALC